MKKTLFKEFLGLMPLVMIIIAFTGCDQPNALIPEEAEALQAVVAEPESTVKAQDLRTNRELAREEFIRMRQENRRLTSDERRQLAPEGLNARRGRAVVEGDNTEVSRPRVAGRRRVNPDGGEGIQRRESRRRATNG